MSLKGTAMTNKVVRGKIKDIHQIEDVEALYAEAEELIARAEKLIDSFQGGLGRIAYIDLLASGWQGTESPYAQVIAIDGVTANSKVDLNPSIDQLAIFHEKDIAFVAENEDGVVTVYCIGQKPTQDYQMQITITEVLANG